MVLTPLFWLKSIISSLTFPMQISLANSAMRPRVLEILHLTMIVVFLCLLQPAIAQAIDPDSIDYTIIPGWTDLGECLRIDCFNNGGGRCTAGSCNGPNNAVGCTTNQCMCRPSLLYQSLQYIVKCGHDNCQNLDDVQLGNDSVRAYCSIK